MYDVCRDPLLTLAAGGTFSLRGGTTQSRMVECSADDNENVITLLCAANALLNPTTPTLPPPMRGEIRGVSVGVRSNPPPVGKARELPPILVASLLNEVVEVVGDSCSWACSCCCGCKDPPECSRVKEEVAWLLMVESWRGRGWGNCCAGLDEERWSWGGANVLPRRENDSGLPIGVLLLLLLLLLLMLLLLLLLTLL